MSGPSWFYTLVCCATRLLLRLLTACTVSGVENVPHAGGLVVISNHISVVDPVLLAAVFPRPITFMGKAEVFRVPLLNIAIRGFGGFPVRRGTADLSAIQQALRILAAGGAVGIFPEGTRSRAGALLPAHAGAGLIAMRSRNPMVPVALSGTPQIARIWPILFRPAIRISIGKPFYLRAGHGGAEAATWSLASETMMRSIADMLPPERRGTYG